MSLVGLLGAISLLTLCACVSTKPRSDGQVSYPISADTWTMKPPIPSMGN